MMKHIIKKAVDVPQVDKDKLEEAGKLLHIPDGRMPEIKFKDVKHKQAILFMDNEKVLRAFFYNDNGNVCTIPIANPVLIYFHTSQIELTSIHSTKKQLLDLFRDNKPLSEESLQLFYDFFGICSRFVTLLMTAMEAFVNQKIPLNFQLSKKEGTRFTRVYDYDQIQRWVTLEDKIADILDKTSNKNFAHHFPMKQTHLNNLKKLRDSIVHTKSGRLYNDYTELFRTTLNFKFNEAIEAVRDFINYYEPELIEPCTCGVDF